MKTLNIYLASSFKYKNICEMIREELEEHPIELGMFKVPDIWWNIDSKKSNLSVNVWYNQPITKAISARHFQSIKNCDALVLCCPISEEGIFNGANVEVGYALALGIPVYSFGKIAMSAMYSDVIKCYTMESLMDCLEIQALRER
jgi:nucleoside 2-deoxyribosyltransferase